MNGIGVTSRLLIRENEIDNADIGRALVIRFQSLDRLIEATAKTIAVAELAEEFRTVVRIECDRSLDLGDGFLGAAKSRKYPRCKVRYVRRTGCEAQCPPYQCQSFVEASFEHHSGGGIG